MSRRLGREGRVAVSGSTVFTGRWGRRVGGRLAWGVPGLLLTASWELPPWTTPTQGFPGAVPPTLGLSWEGCALPPPRGGTTAPPLSCRRLGSHSMLGGLGSRARRAKGCCLFSHAFKESFLPACLGLERERLHLDDGPGEPEVQGCCGFAEST